MILKSQNKLYNALVMIHNKPNNDNNNIRNNNDNNINGPFDSWGNPSSAPYQNDNTTASFSMAAFSGDGSSPEPEEVLSLTLLTFQNHLLLVALPQLFCHHQN